MKTTIRLAAIIIGSICCLTASVSSQEPGNLLYIIGNKQRAVAIFARRMVFYRIPAEVSFRNGLSDGTPSFLNRKSKQIIPSDGLRTEKTISFENAVSQLGLPEEKSVDQLQRFTVCLSPAKAPTQPAGNDAFKFLSDPAGKPKATCIVLSIDGKEIYRFPTPFGEVYARAMSSNESLAAVYDADAQEMQYWQYPSKLAKVKSSKPNPDWQVAIQMLKAK